jgi:hypothetical protein
MHPKMESVQSSRPSVECGSSAAAFAIAPLPQSNANEETTQSQARDYCENAARSKWFMKICIKAVR